MNGSVTCTRRQCEETDCDLNPIGTCTNNKNSNRSSGKHTTENPDATRAEPLITKHGIGGKDLPSLTKKKRTKKPQNVLVKRGGGETVKKQKKLKNAQTVEINIEIDNDEENKKKLKNAQTVDVEKDIEKRQLKKGTDKKPWKGVRIISQNFAGYMNEAKREEVSFQMKRMGVGIICG